ncbi:hypothetical protein EWM64_g6400 [Hericium alpestre]|uniref:NmrA-like domain-containing protein n=1 Tax=Hericium alpestre TaxID=135208 RepID=A0A4Y9ZTS6_9AGAM|nr:hypothetical protein EWM64_g6400 [Hericium alpestre]
MTIVLTGATGGLGSQVFKYLSKFIPLEEIVVSLHNPAGGNFPKGVEVRKGDFADPASLDVAFRGADKLLIVSYPSIAHELRVRHHVNAIDAVKRAGIKHVYYTSLAFADGSVSEVMQAHLDTEAYLHNSGLTYTVIREGLYCESYPLYFGFFDASKTDIYVPGDGRIVWTSREDLGEGTARLMADDGYENQKLLFSGPPENNLTLAQLAEIITRVLGREVKVHVVSVDEYVQRNQMDDPSNPRSSEEFLRAWARTYDAMARGETNKIDPLLQQVLGRPLRTMERYLKDTLSHKEVDSIDKYAK